MAASKIDVLKEKARESLHTFFSKLIEEDTVFSLLAFSLECGSVSGMLREDALQRGKDSQLRREVHHVPDRPPSEPDHIGNHSAPPSPRPSHPPRTPLFVAFSAYSTAPSPASSPTTKSMRSRFVFRFPPTQEHCFGKPLSLQELANLKATLSAASPDAVTPAGITESGFLTLMRLFLSRDRSETVWTALRAMDYDDQLQLRVPRLSTLPHIHYELSAEAQQFLLGVKFKFKFEL